VTEKPAGQNNKFSSGARGPDRAARRRAAEAAGMTRHQMHTAMAIASIPEDEFEDLIERDELPTTSELPRIGRGHKEPKPKTSKLATLVNAWNAAEPDDRAAFLDMVEAPDG